MASFVETRGHAGDEKDFEALYETYRSDVQRLASYLLRNASDAEDAAQTVFLNVLRALRQGVTPSDPRAWLLAITRNVCFSRHRAAAARPAFVELDFETADEPSSDETPSADEIVGALARMLPNQRTALILRDFRGVSRAEIGHLMTLSPVAVEALLTRARAAFREELEAGEQEFECAETRMLVEQQLDGLITVAERHSLRSHLRNCGPCSTLARAVRSSRGKLAGLIFWPFDLISRLAGAFSQAPSVAHVAAAITSTAAVATVAIPVAVSTGSGPVVAGWPASAPAAAAVAAPASASVAAAARPANHTVASTIGSRAKTKRQSLHKITSAAKAPGRHAIATTTPSATGPRAATASPAQPTTTLPTHGAAAPTTSLAASASSPSAGATTANAASPHASPTRSTSPGAKAKAKAKSKAKPRPTGKSGRRRGGNGRHVPEPRDVSPPSTPPAASLPTPGDSGPATAGPGATGTADKSPAKSSSSSADQSPNSQESRDVPSSNPSSGNNGPDPGDKGKNKDKDKDGDGGTKPKH